MHVPRARRGYVKYAATAIAAVLFLHGAATFALHHRLHLQGHGRHHSIDGEQDRPPPPETADAPPPPEHAPAAAAHAAAEQLKAKPAHRPDGGRPQAPKKPPAKSPPKPKVRVAATPLPRRFRHGRVPRRPRRRSRRPAKHRTSGSRRRAEPRCPSTRRRGRLCPFWVTERHCAGPTRPPSTIL